MGKLIINGPLSIECETGQVSDGYHTFDELYDHRCLNFLAFQAMLHWSVLPQCPTWKSRRHHDDTGFQGWFIAGIELPQGQITYHIPDKFWDLCKAPERERAPQWDGHASADVIERLRLWLSVPAFPSD